MLMEGIWAFKRQQYLCSGLWFPKMDSEVESMVRRCIACQAVTSSTRREPLRMTPLPPLPWQLVAADIFGPLPGGEKVLVLKCLRSKWPELKVFLRNQSTDADGVISAMEKMFLTHGIPETVRTDNGPPFNSKSFKSFSERIGFQTKKVTPLWPEANGQAEAFMKCLGKIVCTAYIENKDWKTEPFFAGLSCNSSSFYWRGASSTYVSWQTIQDSPSESDICICVKASSCRF